MELIRQYLIIFTSLLIFLNVLSIDNFYEEKIKQYEKDLNDLYNWKKCPNDFSFKYAMLLEIPGFIIFTIISAFLLNIIHY